VGHVFDANSFYANRVSVRFSGMKMLLTYLQLAFQGYSINAKLSFKITKKRNHEEPNLKAKLVRSVVLNRAAPPRGASIKSKECTSPYAPYKIESLIKEFTNKYTCFYSVFEAMEA